MLVSIVGQASFHTAGLSGPSTMVRSYFRRSGCAGGAAAGAAGFAAEVGAVTSVIVRNMRAGTGVRYRTVGILYRKETIGERVARDAGGGCALPATVGLYCLRQYIHGSPAEHSRPPHRNTHLCRNVDSPTAS